MEINSKLPQLLFYQNFLNLINAIDELVIYLSSDLNIFSANQAVKKKFHCTDSTLLGSSFKKFCTDYHLKGFLTHHFKQLKLGEIPLELITTKKDREQVVWVIKHLLDDKNKWVGFF